MMIEEAVKILTVSDYPCDMGEYKAALTMAVKALAKEAEEPAVYAYCEEIEDWAMTCPACHAQRFHEEPRCWQCGQALLVAGANGGYE